MEKDERIDVIAKTEGIEIIIEKDAEADYKLLITKPQALELALNILNTLYKTGMKI